MAFSKLPKKRIMDLHQQIDTMRTTIHVMQTFRMRAAFQKWQEVDATLQPSTPQRRVSAHFFVLREGQSHGPYPHKMMVEMYEQGYIGDDSTVARSGDKSWKTFRDSMILTDLPPLHHHDPYLSLHSTSERRNQGV